MTKDDNKDYIIINKHTIKKAFIVLFVCALVAVIIIMLFKIDNLQNQISDLKQQVEQLSKESENVSSLEITKKSYYKDYEIDDSTYIKISSQQNQFMVYFHSDSCYVCEQANVYIDKYITLGYQNYIPIYFATKDKVPSLFANEGLGLEVTPTMVFFNQEENTYQVFEGYDEILNLLSNIVAQAKEEQ